jgi:diguanylate cyclase (GGDEF)-like protein
MDDPRRDRIRLAQLHLYVDNHLNDRFTAAPLTVVTAALLTNWIAPWKAATWAVIELLIIATYIGCYLRFRSVQPQPEGHAKWARRIGLAHGAHMASWSSIIVWGWQPGDFSSLIFTMLIHLGLISLTAAMSNPHRALLMSDMAIPLVALMLPPALSTGIFNLGLAALGGLYGALMLIVALKIHATTTQSLLLRQHNEELIAELERQATRDSLTGVASRRHFLETANAEMRRATRFRHPMALLMLDIDHFKRINDTYGHLVGDRVIRAVADACAPVLRACDCLGRLGGEEFAVVLPESDEGAALKVAQRLREAICEQSITVAGEALRVSVSVGVTMLEVPGEPLSHLLHRADLAMYRAKRLGRNRVEVECGHAQGAVAPRAEQPIASSSVH